MGRVIRAVRTGSARIPAEVYDAKREAVAIVEAARRDAERIRAEAQREGRAAGMAEAARSLFDLSLARAQALREAERDLIDASLRIASHLLGRAIERDPPLMASMVAPWLARLRRAKRIVVHVHPEDARALREALATLSARAELEGVIELSPSPELARGDCVLESKIGTIDARVETRIAELSKALHEQDQAR